MLNFIHLTDCHFLDDASETTKDTNPFSRFSNIIEHIKKAQIEYQFVLITGDISQAGSNKSYQAFIKKLETLKKPYYCLPGNHDDADLLKTLVPTSPNKKISINQIGENLLVLLNSQNTGKESGIISTENLAELETTLDNNIHPVIVALHHPPINMQSPWLDKINLSNKEVLLALLENYPYVKVILFGHAHQKVDKLHKHIRLLGTPSTSYQFSPHTQTMKLDPVSPGYRTIQLKATGHINTQIFRVINAQ